MIRKLKKIYNAFILIKLDLRSIFAYFFELPRYFRDWRSFSRLLQNKQEWPMDIYPILLDHNSESASLGEYFWQDLLVAKEIIKQSPDRHIDVGSRIDGFIAHLACFRKVEVFDIRPLTVNIENVKFTQWDITHPNATLNDVAECVSCLHTLEHIGLGRYGDKLDPDGWKKAFKSLVNLVAQGGGLWISVPIGVQKVRFNAHRVFSPVTIVRLADHLGIKLRRFFYLTKTGFIESNNVRLDIESFTNKNYSLGIFFFSKDINEVNK
jgi:hypothetical protein